MAVGTRRPHKNFALLVRAVDDVKQATLVFVGEADERFRDDAAEAARPLGRRVRFLGKVDEGDLPALYNLATVVACPSLIEGFGLPVLEAMACGTPVVCSDIPVFREVAGNAAAYAQPSDRHDWAARLDEVLGSPARREHLSQLGLKRSASYTWRRAAEALIPAYSSLGLSTTVLTTK
jgi:glycosyltransferase involved in cell wall biosynthesis